MKNYAIILASGNGNRFGADIPKQFTKINGNTMFELAIEAFEQVENIDGIVAVVTPGYKNFAEEIIAKNNYKKVISVAEGGELRKDSSYNGISSITDEEANVLIHDCARPFVSKKIIENCLKALENHSAVAVAIPSTDTLIEVKNNFITRIPDRNSYMRVQTPQCFKLSVIRKAHSLAKNDKNFTDDCGLVARYNLCDIYVVEGERKNLKITYPEDVVLAEYLN